MPTEYIVSCPMWVNRVGLAMSGSLPLFPQERRYSGHRGTSRLCQKQTAPQRRGIRVLGLSFFGTLVRREDANA